MELRVQPSEVTAGEPLVIRYSVRASANLSRLREFLGESTEDFIIELTGQGAETCLEGSRGYVHYLYMFRGGGRGGDEGNLSEVVIYAKVKFSVYIMDAYGRVVWRMSPYSILEGQISSQSDVSSVTDWLSAGWSESLSVRLPKLPEGVYTLAVKVEDLLTNATDIKTVEIRVRAGCPWEEFQPKPIQVTHAREALREFLKWARSSGWCACYLSEGYEWNFELGRALPTWTGSILLVREVNGSYRFVGVRLLVFENSSVACDVVSRIGWWGDIVREIDGVGDRALVSFSNPETFSDPISGEVTSRGAVLTLSFNRWNAVAVLISEEWNLGEGSLGWGCPCVAQGGARVETQLASEGEIIALGRLLDASLTLESETGG